MRRLEGELDVTYSAFLSYFPPLPPSVLSCRKDTAPLLRYSSRTYLVSIHLDTTPSPRGNFDVSPGSVSEQPSLVFDVLDDPISRVSRQCYYPPPLCLY